MSRPGRLLIVAGLMCTSWITLHPSLAQAADDDLQLLSQTTFNLAADGIFSATVALPRRLVGTDLTTATIAVSVHDRIVDRATLAGAIAGPLTGAGDTVIISPTSWAEPVAVSAQLEATVTAAESSTAALRVSRSGLYPVTIAVQRNGTTVSQVLTFINRLPVATEASLATEDMQVALAIGTHSSPRLDSKATVSLDASTATEMSTLADALDALAPAQVPATVRIAPAVLRGLALLDKPLFDRLIVALGPHTVTADPSLPLDASVAAAAGQQELFTRWLRDGEDDLASLLGVPSSRATVLATAAVSSEGAALRRNLGAGLMVMTPELYDGLDGSIGGYSDFFGALVAAELPGGATLDTAVVDHIIAQLLTEPLTTPAQTAVYAVAHLLALQQGFAASTTDPRRHAVVIATADLGVPDPVLIGPIAALIAETPGLAAATLDDISLRTDRLLVGDDEKPVTLPSVNGDALITRIETRRVLINEIDDTASMLPADDERPAGWHELAAILPTTALDDAAADAAEAGIRDQLTALRTAVQLPLPYTISLPGQSSTVRVRFVNTADVALKIKAQLTSPSGKLVFTNPEEWTLEPGVQTEIPFTVRALANGTSGVSLDVLTPNGVPLANTIPLKFRVNALGVGNVVTLALIVLVVLWWLHHFRSVRRKRRVAGPATLPAS